MGCPWPLDAEGEKISSYLTTDAPADAKKNGAIKQLMHTQPGEARDEFPGREAQ